MHGLMMELPLLISSVIDYAADVFGATEIATRTVEGPIHRYTWSAAHLRSRKLAQALRGLEVRAGDTVATLAWNTHRHLELYFGVTGMGAVVHTVNPRLHPTQLAYVLNHAADRALFVDLTFVPVVRAVRDQLASVRHVVIMTDAAHMPKSDIDGALCYEDLLAAEDGDYGWPIFDERSASGICYTSGTTGHPKGVVYSHRSTVLHAYSAAMQGGLTVYPREAVLPAVPMFHVNAWGLPYEAALCGCKLVMPGPRLDGPGLTELMAAERVAACYGVPTVHLSLLQHWQDSGRRVPSLKLLGVGGAAPTRSLVEAIRAHGIDVVQGWGMTETSPVGTISELAASEADLTEDEKITFLTRQGRPRFGVQLRIVDPAGHSLPRDGKTMGELQIRGHWVAAAYLGQEAGGALDAEGWFPTGDMAVIHPDGTLQITDRIKDLIKSGGEWISSLDLESAVTKHPEVALAAVIARPDPKWGERPLLIVQPAPGASPTRESLLDFLEGQVPKWWLPDDVEFVASMPLGATGKVQKAKLREAFGRA